MRRIVIALAVVVCLPPSVPGQGKDDERVQVHVLRNLYWGEEGKFDMYNGSDLRKQIEGRGGKTLNFPDVADRVSEAINKDRLPIHKAVAELSFGSRIELQRWQGEYKMMLAEIVR